MNVYLCACLQELAEKKAELQRREAGVKCITHPYQETRSVEELLSFIEEERQGQAKKQGKKKRSKKKKDANGDAVLESMKSSESKQSCPGEIASYFNIALSFVSSPPSPLSPPPGYCGAYREAQPTQDLCKSAWSNVWI